MVSQPKLCPRCAISSRATCQGRESEGLRILASSQGALVPLLPCFSCPACIAAYAEVISVLGLGFLFTEQVLLPLVALSLLFGVASIAWTMRATHQKAPLVLAGIAALLLAAGRPAWSLPIVVCLSVAGFVFAAGWKVWLRPRAMRKELPA